MFCKIQVIWQAPVFVSYCYCLNSTNFRVQNNANFFLLELWKSEVWNRSAGLLSFLKIQERIVFPVFSSFWKLPVFQKLPIFLGSWSLPTCSQSAMQDLLSSLAFASVLTSSLYDSDSPASLLQRSLWLRWIHLNNPGYSPHIKILNLFTSMKSLLLCKIIFTGSRD